MARPWRRAGGNASRLSDGFRKTKPITGRAVIMGPRWASFCETHPTKNLLRRLSRLDALYPRGAILELRDLSERIKRRIGKQVRRRFHVGEGDEHDTVRNRVVLAHRELDGAPAGRDPD